MVIFGIIIAVAFDGKVKQFIMVVCVDRLIRHYNIFAQVHLVEACSFPFLYVLYLIVVIGTGCIRVSLLYRNVSYITQ